MVGFRVGRRNLTRVKKDRGRDRGYKLSLEWNCDFGVGGRSISTWVTSQVLICLCDKIRLGNPYHF